MNIKRVTYCALAALAFAASCSKEAAEPDVYDWLSRDIRIKPKLSDVSSTRALNMTLGDLKSFQVTCFNTGDYNKEATDQLPPYFEDSKFISDDGLTYYSQMSEPWPVDSLLGVIRFYAFSPSLSEMSGNNSDLYNGAGFFKLNHSVEEINSTPAIGYRLDKMRVNPDILKQYDFITADVSGDRYGDFGNGVELAFHHQMSQVEIRAWGGSTSYNIEIAGIRLGNPIVESSYVFSDATSPGAPGTWSTAGESVKGKVEYIYRNDNNMGGGKGTGDKIYFINKNEHNTEESAESIMGIGGNAMVIPGVNERWEGLDDPNIGSIPYKTDKMYFSVLLRVTDPSSGAQQYPYPGNRGNMTVITYAVNQQGVIIYRLYPGNNAGEYFTDSSFSNRYKASEGLEIHEYGWAAVPVEIDWKAGKRYVYTLNYSDGVGVQDPEDPNPGEKILKDIVLVNVDITDWIEGTNTDVNVPRK